MATTKQARRTPGERFAFLGGELQRELPHVWKLLEGNSDFISLHLKAKADGSILCVAKKYGDDGGPLVLFGGGYGFVGALMALDASLQGDKWRTDKPWSNGK